MIDTVLVPKERFNIVRDRPTKTYIEQHLKVKLSFEDTSAIIEGEGLDLYQAKLIIQAIANGFSPVHAYKLLKEDVQLQIIDLNDYSDKKKEVIKSRIIGRNGRVREEIEKASKAFVSVYGKTVSIIGTPKQIEIARNVIELIIRGAHLKRILGMLRGMKE